MADRTPSDPSNTTPSPARRTTARTLYTDDTYAERKAASAAASERPQAGRTASSGQRQTGRTASSGQRQTGRVTVSGQRQTGRTTSSGQRQAGRTANSAQRQARRSAPSSQRQTSRTAGSRQRGTGGYGSGYPAQGGYLGTTTYATRSYRPILILALIAVAIIAASVIGCSVQQAHRNREQLEAADKAALQEQLKPTTITFAAFGDIVAHDEMIGHARTSAGSYDFNPVFEPMLERLAKYDVTSITQETPLVTDEAKVGGYPVFGTPVQMGDAIVNAGFDIVTSATNHSMDQGTEGILDTVKYWKEKHPEITLLGLHDDPAKANGVTVIERDGIRIALTDCTYGLNGFVLPAGEEYEVDMLDDLETIAKNVEEVRDDVDLVICYVHMGVEYATVPSDEQREVAARLIDAGADVVLGSHVHVVQPMEEVTTEAGNTGIVYFSLGNNASNQADMENMLGGAAVLTIEKTPDPDGGKATTRVVSHEFVPTFCYYDYTSTKMYFLDDFTDDMAMSHFITTYGHPFTVADVRQTWTDITGLK